jgi:sigma-B regulation protein RsbU (phosphoserine phosphatase)
VVLGDVSGKGVGAAMLMSHVTACYRLLFDICPDMAELAERLNQRVFVSSDTMSFVTLFLGKLDPKTHRFRYVSAGHNPALLMCPGKGVMELSATGLPIGLMESTQYEVKEINLPPGCLLCVYSDGITEAQVSDEFYGEERLLEGLQKRIDSPLEDVVSGLLEDLSDFLGDEEADDDITLFLLRRSE